MADERATRDQLLAAVDARLAQLLAPFIADLTRRVARAGGKGTITPAGRQGLAQWLPRALAALFGATPAKAEALYATPGTVPHLLAASIRAAARVAVAPVVADVTNRLAGQPALLAAVTGPAPKPRPPLFDPARTWVSPDGYKLSDRIWRSGDDLRSRIDGLLDYHIQRGTNAVDVGRELELYLTTEGRFSGRKVRVKQPDGSYTLQPQQITTKTPYGTSGLANPRRLARTEITRAYGAATTEAARVNPFVAGLRWRLSSSHPEMDQCDERASADPDGLGTGVYRVGNVPRYPDHPNCLCVLVPVTRRDTAAVIAAIARGDVPGGLDADAIVAAVGGF